MTHSVPMIGHAWIQSNQKRAEENYVREFVMNTGETIVKLVSYIYLFLGLRHLSLFQLLSFTLGFDVMCLILNVRQVITKQNACAKKGSKETAPLNAFPRDLLKKKTVLFTFGLKNQYK